MEPERGLIERLHDKGAADDDEAREEYDEHCRSIAGVDEAVIKPAHIAMGWQTEETTEQLTPTALRAPAHQPGKQRRHRRTGGLIRHDILAKQKRGDLGRPCPKAPAGWVERSETHLRPFSAVSPAMGFNPSYGSWTSMSGGLRRTVTPYIYAGEQEEPHDVNEVPVPGGKFKPQMLLGRELPGQGTNEAHDQENRPDDDMGAVESCRHEEGGAVDMARIVERRVHVFVSLNAGEREAERNRKDEAPFQAITVVVQQGVVRPGHRGAGRQQDQGIEQG